MTLVEIMIATAVAAVLSAAALQLFAGLIRYSRLTAMSASIQDRMRLAREILTHDLLRTGYYWSREAQNTALESTGSFGVGGTGSGIGGWPGLPVSGVSGGAGAADQLYLIVPNGDIVGANGAPRPTCSEGGAMSFNIPYVVPAVDLTNFNAGRVVLASGSGVVFLSTISTAPTAPTAGSPGANGSIGLSALGVGQCVLAGSAPGRQVPGRFSIYPVEAVIWTSSGNNLVRQGRTGATGPIGVAVDANRDVTLAGVDDFQVRYRYMVSSIDESGAVTATSFCTSDDPAELTNPTATVACAGSEKRRAATPGSVADGVAPTPMVRFVGLELAISVRSEKQDFKEFTGRGRRPSLFDRSAGGSDSFRRRTASWITVVPNSYVY